MFSQPSSLDYKKPAVLFSIGLCLVVLIYWIPYIPNWFTFIHMWRAETAASILLLVTLGYAAYHYGGSSVSLVLSRDEIKFIVLPVLAFIIWSGISMAWAQSWKSALHHTLVWSMYLIFYLIVRHLINGDRNYGRLVTMLTVSFVLISIPAVIEYCAFLAFGGSSTLGLRYAKYGEPINTILPLLIAGTLRLSGRRFALGAAAVVALWLLIFCTFGRINVILFLAGLIAVAAAVFVFKQFHRYRRKMAFIVLTIILAPLPLHLFLLFASAPEIVAVSRFAGNEVTNSSKNFRKLMNSLSLEMFLANPVTGIGADNFGQQVNNYRASYALENPGDVNLANAENEIPERAHNEFLQVSTELGSVGGLILLWLLGSILLMAFRAFRDSKKSLIPLAALIGTSLFLASSVVSSYSFRFVQNGFFFFFVLAVGARFLLKEKGIPEIKPLTAGSLRLGYAFGIAICLTLLSCNIVRVTAVYLSERANNVSSYGAAAEFLNAAVRLDNENANIERSWGMRLIHEARFADAAPHLERSIDLGLARSVDFSYLATAQALANDIPAAEKTFERAANLYPRSTFVLTRYAAILKTNGKEIESAKALLHARQINKREANTWWLVLTESPTAASIKASGSEDYSAVMDLKPLDALYAVVREREIRNPEEKFNFNPR